MSLMPGLQQQEGQQPSTSGISPPLQQWQQQQPACRNQEAAGQASPPPQPHYSAASASIREQLLRHRWAQVFMTAVGLAAAPVVAAFNMAEWPLTVARRAVVPLVAPECYNQQWFLAAMALSPLFASLYLQQVRKVDWLVVACCYAYLSAGMIMVFKRNCTVGQAGGVC